MVRRLQKHQLVALTRNEPCPAPKPPRKNLESEIQRSLVKWWDGACGGFGLPSPLLFSVPNGGNWNAKRGSIMKAEGQRPGVPDLFLAVSRWPNGYGLFLELKTPHGVVMPEQQVFHEILRSQGFRVEVIRSLFTGIDSITQYLTK